ncbi:ectoine/hydroxyectoine ABC transporter substrate-binding protein EhuB [Kibdelosporangium aridum]|uniref:Amino acid ABC transporter substrate-binding protein, PAAT family n=1 Tax=Kibdelosporangium aridum TaxID=2030 RepID=A0A1W2FF21_KIBAR|nr:ectoine/hydroxyectoine ABC transporter substrate-binding protein EhuB [Kibdelosporangium aridum]SMD20236.1 amino acid ABC transporter substrate-binding protein, PAAT family [Kibdelosporangium aridum]
MASRRLLLQAAAAGALSLALPGCTRVDLSAEANGGSLLDRLRQKGEVRVGFANEAPYSFINSEAELTGEAAEVAKVVFRRLGVPNLIPIPSEFGSLIAGLKVGLFDVIAAGMSILPKRCKQVLFTNPDFIAPAAFLVPKGNPKGIKTFAEVAQQNLRMGVLIGATEKDYAIANGVPENMITAYQNQPSGLEAVSTGRVDAFSLTAISLRDVLGKNPGAPLEVTTPFVPEVDGKPQFTSGGFAFLPDQTNAVAAFNKELADLKQSGELLRILRPFGFTEAEMTDMTAQQLCAVPEA